MSLILAPRRQRQADLYEFQASLVYRASSRTAKAIQRNSVLKNKKMKKEIKKANQMYKDVRLPLKF